MVSRSGHVNVNIPGELLPSIKKLLSRFEAWIAVHRLQPVPIPTDHRALDLQPSGKSFIPDLVHVCPARF